MNTTAMGFPSMRLLGKLLAFGLALTAMSMASADFSKRDFFEFDANDLDRLELEISVGEIEIEVYDGEIIELDLSLEADRNWFSLRRPSVDDIELEQRLMGSKLYLGIERDNLEQTWRLRVPRRLALEIEVGIGDLEIDGLVNDLELELGVGAARINVASENYAEITAKAGVGDALVRGFERGADNERRALIGADAYYVGEGEYEIRAEVGVGDVQIRRR